MNVLGVEAGPVQCWFGRITNVGDVVGLSGIAVMGNKLNRRKKNELLALQT